MNYAQLAKEALAGATTATASSVSSTVVAATTIASSTAPAEAASSLEEASGSSTSYNNGMWSSDYATATSDEWQTVESSTSSPWVWAESPTSSTEDYWVASSTTIDYATSVTETSSAGWGEVTSSEAVWEPSSSSSLDDGMWYSQTDPVATSSAEAWEPVETVSAASQWEEVSSSDYWVEPTSSLETATAAASSYDDGMWTSGEGEAATLSVTLVTVSSIDNWGQTWYLSTTSSQTATAPSSTATYPVVGVSRTTSVIPVSTSVTARPPYATDASVVLVANSSISEPTTRLSSTAYLPSETTLLGSSAASSSIVSTFSAFPTAGVSTTTMVGGDGFTTTAIISIATMTSSAGDIDTAVSSTQKEAFSESATLISVTGANGASAITVTAEETVTAPAVTSTYTLSTTSDLEVVFSTTVTSATTSTSTSLTFIPHSPYTATTSSEDSNASETGSASSSGAEALASISSDSPVSCPVQGAPCAVHGELACNGFSYGQCVWGTWVVRQCYTGLACKTDGTGVYCDYPGPSGVQECSATSTSSEDSSDEAAKLMRRDYWVDDEYFNDVPVSNDIWQHTHRKSKRGLSPQRPVAKRESSPFFSAELGKKHFPHVPVKNLHSHEEHRAAAKRAARIGHMHQQRNAKLKRDDAPTPTSTTPEDASQVTATSVFTTIAGTPTMLRQIEFCPDGSGTAVIAGSSTISASTSTATANTEDEVDGLTITSDDSNTYLLRVSIQQLNSTNFAGTLYAAPLTNSPVGQHWKFSFTSDDRIDSVSRGELASDNEGSYTITSIAEQEGKSYMAITVTFWGTYSS